MIYAIKANSGMVKIGYTKTQNTLAARLKSLQTGNGSALRILAVTSGSLNDERKIHDALEKYRACGEWFHPNGFVHRMVSLINQSSSASEAISRYMTWGYIDGKRGSSPLSRSARKKMRRILSESGDVTFHIAAKSAGYSDVEIETFRGIVG